MDLDFDDLPIFPGTLLGDLYKVEAFLGQGGFGFVTKCRNVETGKVAAIKVNKNHSEQAEQAKKEIDILRRVRCLDPDTCNIVRYHGFFFHENFICLSFELLDQSLFDYMEDRRNQALPMAELRSIVQQLATALFHLKSTGIVHADLKPENVMVVNRWQQPLRVKLIDFGLACPVFATRPGVCVQTTWYRAPEIMLHIPFDEAIDMWSLGLIVAELATGQALYPGDWDYEMLSFIIQTQGQPADYVLNRGTGTHHYFNYQGHSQQLWRFKTPAEFHYETGIYIKNTRRTRLNSLDDLEHLMDRSRGDQGQQHLVVDLIKRMLQLDSEQRITPEEALQHPFFTHSLPQSSHDDDCTPMINTEGVTPEIKEQPPCCVTKQPESIQSMFERTTASLGADSEPNTEEKDVQPETKAEDQSWFSSIFRNITDGFHCFCFH